MVITYGVTVTGVTAAFPQYAFAQGRLGRGGMKDAFEIESGGVSRVLKIARQPVPDPDAEADDTTDPEPDFGVLRVLREIRAIKRIDHPGVVKIVLGPRVVEINGESRICWVEPFYPGGTLAGVLGAGVSDSGTVLGLMVSLADAAEAIALANLIHRDIKPSNILFDTNGDPVIIDFGVAFDTDDEGITGTNEQAPNSARYTAPEWIRMPRDVKPDHRSDMFLMGIVAFQLLTGVHPFGSNDAAYRTRLFAGDIDEDALSRSICDEDLRVLLRRLLSASPSSRFRNFKILKTAIEACR